MSAQDRFEQRLSGRLEDLASPSTPSYFNDVIQATARTRQRPGWSFPERWVPVSAITDRMVSAPRAPVRILAFAALVILALVAMLIVVAGSREQHVPAPFGPADNGRIVWADSSGAILAAEVGTTGTETLVPGPGNDRPLFSPDGTRLLYLHTTPTGVDIVTGGADGSGAVTIASRPSGIGAVWAPDGRSIVIADNGTLWRLDARPGAVAVKLAAGVNGAYDFNGESAALFRPPGGDEIAFVRDAGNGKAIVVARADGSAPRELLSPATAAFSYTDLANVRWSPDGRRLVFMATVSDNEADTRVYVMNADGSDVRRLTKREFPAGFVSEGNPQWSPDGREILMQVWLQTGDQTDARPLTVVDVDSRDEREVGSVSPNGFSSFAWSPDGRSILAVTDSGELAVIDPASGGQTTQPWPASSGASWQRIHR